MNGPADPSQGPLAPSTPFTAAQWGWLCAITALGALLRLYGLDTWAFWVDEAHTWRDATLPGEIFWSSNRAYYPTSYVIVRWLLDVLDPQSLSEGVLRLPFALAGIVSVPLLAFVGRPLVGAPAAIFAGLLLAIDPWHIYWSQNARSYVLVFLFALLTGGLFWTGVQRRSRALCLLAMLLGLVAVSCHLTGGLMFAPMIAFPLLANRVWTPRFIGALAAALLAAFVLLPYLRHVPPFHEFALAKANPDLSHLLQTVAFYFRLSLLLVAALGLWIQWQERDRSRPLYLALWAILPLLALAVLGGTLVKTTARYAFCTLPAVLLLASYGCVRLHGVVKDAFASRGRTRFLPALAVPALVCVDLLVYDFHYFTVQAGDRAQWQRASEQIHDLEPDSQVTVLTVNEPTMQFYLRRWHYSGDQARIAMTPSEVFSIEAGEMSDKGGAAAWLTWHEQRARDRQRSLYVVVTLPELREKDPGRRLELAIQASMDLVAAYPMSVGPKDETIFVYRSRAAK